jgi:hypothetical protein
VEELDDQHSKPFSDVPGTRTESGRESFVRRSRSRAESRERSVSPGPREPVTGFSTSAKAKRMKGHVTVKEVNRVLGNLREDIRLGGRVIQELQDDMRSSHRPQPHIGLGGVHHNPTQAPTDSGPMPGMPSVPRRELRDPHPVTQGTYKIYDHANPPKRSDFLEQALFGSVQIEPRLASQSEWQKMPGYEATPVPPPPSSKTPFGKYVEPRHPVAAFALSPSGPIQGSDEPGLAALPWTQTPVVDLTKHFSVAGH